MNGDPTTPTDQPDATLHSPEEIEGDETELGAWMDDRPEQPEYEPVPEGAG